MSTYQEKKKKAREKAIEWQERFGEQSISYKNLPSRSPSLNNSVGAMVC